MIPPTPPPTINYTAWRFWFDVLQLLGTLAIGIYVWWTSREKITSQRFAALEKEVAKRISPADLDDARAKRDKQCAEHRQETTTLNKAYADLSREVSHLPTRSEVKELSDSMRSLTEKIGNLNGRMSGVNRAVDLINQFLIEQGGKK